MSGGHSTTLVPLLLKAVGAAQIAGGLIWAVWIVRAFRRDVKRNRDGLCMACGFDLRHSADRCPECGTPIFKK